MLGKRGIRGVWLASGVLAGGLVLSGCTETPTTDPNKGASTTATVTQLSDDALRDRLDRVLTATRSRHLNTKDHAGWQVLHAALAFGRQAKIVHNGDTVPAMQYLLDGGELVGWNLRPGEKGVMALVESGTKTGQGHKDQWLGYLALGDLEIDEKIIVGGQTYTIRDLVEQAKWECVEGMEATWTLMAFQKFVPMDAEWVARTGEKWTIERLMAMEAGLNMDSAARLNSSACGGTHRLTGLALALRKYKQSLPAEKRNEPLTGGWAFADERIQWAVTKAREYQQQDGTFSTLYFERSASSPDVAKQIGTTGHTLEFLSLVLSDEELKAPWVVRAMESLVSLLEVTQDIEVECGALYHAAHGLVVYRERLFGQPAISPPATPTAARSDAPPPLVSAKTDENKGAGQ